MARHAGRLRDVFLPEGRRRFAAGKDLSEAKILLATGGALTRLRDRLPLLVHLRDLNAGGTMLYPEPGSLRVFCDSAYLMAALGVLSRRWPGPALQMLLTSLHEEAL